MATAVRVVCQSPWSTIVHHSGYEPVAGKPVLRRSSDADHSNGGLKSAEDDLLLMKSPTLVGLPSPNMKQNLTASFTLQNTLGQTTEIHAN